MSFFDDEDEPPTATRRAPRSRRPSGTARTSGGGGGGAQPPDRQAIQIRRAVAAAAILVVLILIVLGVHSCQISARNSALKNYNDNVSSLNQQSVQGGKSFFQLLSGGGGASNPTNLQNQIDEARVTAENLVNRARGIDVPGEVKDAQRDFLLVLQMRRDGIANIARNVQQALGSSTSKDALSAIASEMARFYASDVLYKDYTLPLIAGALHGASLSVGGFDAGQFLPDVQWLTSTFIASQLHVSAPTPTGKPAPGLHGHSLDSVGVGGTTLQTGSTNTITANPAPTFTLNFTNGGQNTENNVTCKVTVSGANVSGQTVVPSTTAGEHATCDVALSSAPPAGSYTVTATVSPVPGEKNTANNTLTFPVAFK